MNECTVYKLIKLSLLVDDECKRGLWKCRETRSKNYWNIPVKLFDFLVERHGLDISRGDVRRGGLGSVHSNGTASIKKPMFYLDEIC